MLEREQQETKSLITRLKPTLPDLETLGSQAPMKGQLANYSAVLSEFTMNCSKPTLGRIVASEYQKLQQDAGIQAAIRSARNWDPKR